MHWFARGSRLTAEGARTWLVRAALHALLWWAIAEGRPHPWHWAAAGVILAATLSVLLWPPGRWTLRGVAAFVPFFLVHSMQGGIDVATRALRPGCHVRPGMSTYRFALDDEQARLLLMNVVTLLPGTLSARYDGTEMTVHLLDTTSGSLRLVRTIELRIAGMLRP